jgi:serine/threonine protein kinase
MFMHHIQPILVFTHFPFQSNQSIAPRPVRFVNRFELLDLPVSMPPESTALILRLRNSLGKGSFGVVYCAVDKWTGWKVAWKELTIQSVSPKEIEFFQREVEILLSCNNLFLFKMIRFSLDPTLCIVTEFMSSGSLWDQLRKHEFQLTPNQRQNIAMGIADGMRYLHSQRILHRYLKSGNVLLGSSFAPWNCRLLAWKNGWKCGSNNGPERPEQSNGWLQNNFFTAESSFPVDVYAYGMVLDKLLCERIPFEGLPQKEIYRMLEHGDRPKLLRDFENHPVADLV